MTILDLFALACATSALVVGWMKRDGLFEELRDKIAVWGTYVPADLVAGVPSWKPWIKHKIAQGAQCRICLSFHFAFWLGLIFLAPGFWCKPETALFIKLPIYTLAATRIAIWCFEYDESQ